MNIFMKHKDLNLNHEYIAFECSSNLKFLKTQILRYITYLCISILISCNVPKISNNLLILFHVKIFRHFSPEMI